MSESSLKTILPLFYNEGMSRTVLNERMSRTVLYSTVVIKMRMQVTSHHVRAVVAIIGLVLNTECSFKVNQSINQLTNQSIN